jgi:hypothetical protein
MEWEATNLMISAEPSINCGSGVASIDWRMLLVAIQLFLLGE